MRTSIAAVLIIVATLPAPSLAQSAKGAAVPAGTLTCTMNAPQSSEAEAAVSCSFKAVSGRSANFAGRLVRTPKAELPGGKRVLVWSVLAAQEDLEFGQLAGRYVGRTGGDTRARLTNEASHVVLQPPAATAGVGGEMAVTLLVLKLEPVRA